MADIDPNDAASAALGGQPEHGPQVQGVSKAGQPVEQVGSHSKDIEASAKGSGQTVLVIGVIIVVVILGVVAVMMLTRDSDKRTIETPVVSSFSAIDTNQKTVLNGFMSNYGEKVIALEAKSTVMEGKLDDILRANKELRDNVKDMMEKQNENVKTWVQEKLKAGITPGQNASKSQTSIPQLVTPEEAKIQEALKTYQGDLLNLSTDPKMLRQRVAVRLRAQGLSEDEIKNRVAIAAQEVGRYYLGDVKEDYPTMEEIEKVLPAPLAKMYQDVAQYMQGLGAEEGKIESAMAFEDVKKFVKARTRFTDDKINDEMIKKLCIWARVRRENLEDIEMDYIPFLIAKRDKLQVPKDQAVEMAKFVFLEKEHLPETMSAGKIKTLVDVLMGTINNVEIPVVGSKEHGAHQLDQGTAEKAIKATRLAVKNAYNLGKRDQGDLSDTGTRALKQFLEAARVEASDEQRNRIVLQAINGLMEELRASQAPPVPHRDDADRQPTRDSTSDPLTEPVDASGRPNLKGNDQRQRRSGPTGMQDRRDRQDPQIRSGSEEFGIAFGPLLLRQQDINNGMFWMVPQMLSVIGVDAGTQEGAALLVCANEQNRRFVDELRQSGGLRDSIDIRTTLMPAMIQIMRSMQPLARIDLKLSDDPLLNDSRVGRALRGVILGSIYGPFIQDEAKAKAVASEALSGIENRSILTKEVHAKLNMIAADRPLELAVASLAAYAPGRLPYSAGRFQDVSSMVTERIAAAPTYIGAIAPIFKDDKDDTLGRLSEQLRIFVPMSVAVRDDGRMPVIELAKLVDRDIMYYAGIYAAEFIVSNKVLKDILPNYAMSVTDEFGGPSHLVKIASIEVPNSVAAVVRERQVSITSDSLLSTAEALATEVVPRVERILVREVVLSRVVPRLTRSRTLASPTAIREAVAAVGKRADEMVEAPFTPNRIDEWSSVLTREGQEILDGSSGNASTAPRGQSPGPGSVSTSLGWPAKRIESSAGGKGPLIGIMNGVVRAHKVTIPAASYSNAHIISGIDAEFGGGGTDNETVMLNMPYSWRGPNGSSLVMRNLRLIGKATAKPGPERVRVDVTALSYVFPSGRSIYVPADGFVVDPIEGKAGAPGIWNWNLDKVLPLALVSGAGKGMSEALRSNSQTQVVSPLGGVSTVTGKTDKLEQALLGGLAGGADIITGHVEQVLKDVHPSIGVSNGAVVGIVLNKPVEFDVPEDEFISLQSDGASFEGM